MDESPGQAKGPHDRHEQEPQGAADEDEQGAGGHQEGDGHAGVAGQGGVDAEVGELLADGGFEAAGGAAADGAGELDAGAGELFDGVLGGLAGGVDELLGVGQEQGQDAGGGELALVGEDRVVEEGPAISIIPS